MKMMLNEKQQGKLDELRLQLTKGELSHADVSDLLELEIYTELTQHGQQADNNWLNACSEMMEEVDKEQAAILPDHSKQNWQAIRSTMGTKKNLHFPWKRFTVAVACIAIVFLGVSFSTSWYQGTHSDDGQIYDLTGQKPEISNEQSAIATGNDTLQELETVDYDEVVAFLGTTPPVPAWWPEAWEAEPYYVTAINGSWNLSIYYSSPKAKTMLAYVCGYATNPSMVSIGFPQDAEGQSKVLGNGKKVYFSTNAGDTIAVWQENDLYFSISGPITVDEIVAMIYSVYGGND